MKKIYTVLLVLLPGKMIFAQCPVIRGVLINTCATGSVNEGLNELVVFTTTAASQVKNYKLSYGTANPPSGGTPAASGILSGAGARVANGTGTIVSALGCNISYVTDPNTTIPASAIVVFIPSNFTNTFDVSAYCQMGGTAYVVPIDITLTSSTWSANGVMANFPTTGSSRFIQVENAAEACGANVRSYTNGWPANLDGNFVAWDDAGAPTYSNIGCSLLPVKLVSFTVVGAGKDANISWQTTGETNTRSFELERSSNGTNFTSISTIGAGLAKYGFTDLNIPSGASYYRLKIIDNDGTISYSQIVKVNGYTNRFALTNAYPKPAFSQLTITWNAPDAGSSVATIYDLTGKKLISKQLPTATGMNSAQLQVSTLPKGQYILKLSKDGETQVTQFGKQ